MLELEGVNYWAIAAAWVVNCAVGAYWYSPAGFAKQWKSYTGVDLLKIPEKEATRILLSVVASGLVQAFTLAVVLNSIGTTNAVEGLSAGLLIWFGLVTATSVGVTLYARHGWKFIGLNSAYFLVVIAMNSVILSIW